MSRDGINNLIITTTSVISYFGICLMLFFIGLVLFSKKNKGVEGYFSAVASNSIFDLIFSITTAIAKGDLFLKNGYYVIAITRFDFEIDHMVSKFIVILILFAADLCLCVISIPFYIRYLLICKKQNVHFSLRTLLYFIAIAYNIGIATLFYAAFRSSPTELIDVQMKPYLEGNKEGRYWNMVGAKVLSPYFLTGFVGCSLLTTVSFSLAVFFNYKVWVYLRQDKVKQEQRNAFQGIQKTMIVQLTCHFVMLFLPLMALLLGSLFGVSYLLPFAALIECSPTVTTILTLISVPGYRKKLKMWFRRLRRH